MQKDIPSEAVRSMVSAGAHFGVARSRRHPSVKSCLFGQKDTVDVFDLEKTNEYLEKAKEFARSLGREKKTLLFVGGKPESRRIVEDIAKRVSAPYAVGRWIGGTLTNYSEIKKRVARLVSLTTDKEAGALSKYTKLERLLLDREMKKLEEMYGGIVSLGDTLPHAVFLVDPRREAIVVREAQVKRIPVIALATSDCDISLVQYPIPANDSAPKSIAFFTEAIAQAYEEGAEQAVEKRESAEVKEA
jgi:small subunit ribosomal protein S2